jgi:hypothetical protein
VASFIRKSWQSLRRRAAVAQSQSQSQSYFTTDGQSVRLGVEPNLGLLTREIFFFLKLQSCLNWGALSDERSGLSVVSQSTVVSQYLHKIFTYCVIHI